MLLEFSLNDLGTFTPRNFEKQLSKIGNQRKIENIATKVKNASKTKAILGV